MRRALLVLLLMARVGFAHDVPVEPNSCTFDPIEIGTAVVSPPTAVDALRIVYTVATNQAQFQGGAVPPRTFTVDGVDGSIAFPVVFATTLSTTGDLTFAPVPLTFVVGGATVTVPVVLTTGLVPTAAGVVSGTPIGPGGVVGLAGVIPAGALPSPLDGETTVSMHCQLLPVGPDLDQFAEAPVAANLGGYVKPSKGKLHAVLQVPIGTTVDFTRPALLRLVAGGSEMLTVELPNGLAASGRKFTSTAADGSVVTIKPGKKKPVPTYKLQLATPGQTIAPPPGGRADVQATFEIGGVLARGVRTFKAKSGGLRAP
ncbi:MAG TPA: hypothetical protein VGR62_21585 [Candidatus Binatia bacterium]|jgi:hypothetical protein|nr:hypothetical protein [Candidatus Binatia bacterium]